LKDGSASSEALFVKVGGRRKGATKTSRERKRDGVSLPAPGDTRVGGGKKSIRAKS